MYQNEDNTVFGVSNVFTNILHISNNSSCLIEFNVLGCIKMKITLCSI